MLIFVQPCFRSAVPLRARAAQVTARDSADELSMDACRRPTVLLFGDSITQQSFSESGWGAGISNWYQRSADVVNRGFSGYNTRWAKQILPDILKSAPGPLLAVTLFFGANDAASDGQHVPLEEYEANLQAMIENVKAGAPNAAIIAITPATVDSSRWPTRSIEQVSQYADVVRRLPVSTVVDVWGEVEIEDLNDGLHLGPTGNRKVLALLQHALRGLPGLNPEDGPDGMPQLPLHYPHWSALSGKTEEEAAGTLSAWQWP